MARVTRLEQILGDGYRDTRFGSELGVGASYGEDVL
jgi:hypothetical protein